MKGKRSEEHPVEAGSILRSGGTGDCRAYTLLSLSFCPKITCTTPPMPQSCPQCKAILPAAETCEGRFYTGQLKEIEQPEYYAVHHLSVPCYMLQHNAYAREGWLEVRKLLARFIYDGWTPDMARREFRTSAASRQRNWRFTKGPKLPGVEEITWRFTVAALRLERADHYCADVRRWAECILLDSEQLVRNLASQG